MMHSSDSNVNDSIPWFESTSVNGKPTLLHVTVPPGESLGAQLLNQDTKEPNVMFLPGYAQIGNVFDDSLASKAGIRVGDVIIAINESCFRRFAKDYKEATVVTADTDSPNATTTTTSSDVVDLDEAVIAPGDAYSSLMTKLKAVKAAGGDPPLIITIQRSAWDAPSNAWPRFLLARNNNVQVAMELYQQHETWRESTFPLCLGKPGLQTLLRQHVIGELTTTTNNYPTIYINWGRMQTLQNMGEITIPDIVDALILFTERTLAESTDPRWPKNARLIDLAETSLTEFSVETLKQIYQALDPNYPNTLHKMVIYPVSSLMAMTAKSVLGFVAQSTRDKFVVTDQLVEVCEELGLEPAEIDAAGGLQEFVKTHQKSLGPLVLPHDAPKE